MGVLVLPYDEWWLSDSVEVELSWKIPPGKTLGRTADGFADETDSDDSDDHLDDEEDFELDEDMVEVVVGVAFVDEGGGGAADDDGGAGAGSPSDPSTLKTTMLAVLPLGTVTTQKLAPSPTALLLLLTPLTPSDAGLMAQGRPLQPPPGHSILMP